VRAFFELRGAVINIAVVTDEILAQGASLGAESLIGGTMGANIFGGLRNISGRFAYLDFMVLNRAPAMINSFPRAKKVHATLAEMTATVPIGLTAFSFAAVGALMPGFTGRQSHIFLPLGKRSISCYRRDIKVDVVATTKTAASRRNKQGIQFDWLQHSIR
jgi:hypothetical protein